MGVCFLPVGVPVVVGVSVGWFIAGSVGWAVGVGVPIVSVKKAARSVSTMQSATPGLENVTVISVNLPRAPALLAIGTGKTARPSAVVVAVMVSAGE